MSATEFLYVKTSSGKVVVGPFPYLTIIDVSFKRNLSAYYLASSDPPPSTKVDYDIFCL